MKKRRLDFNYKPLTMLKSIETVGTIPQHQLYDSVTGEYEPDYTLAGFNLVIQPHVSAVYTDGTGESGEVTTSNELTNIVWKEIVNGTVTVITDSTPGYTVITSGEYKCRLIMSKNLTLGTAVTLQFECDYLDTRTNEIHHVVESTLVTVAASDSVPSFSLDRPGTTVWNPFGDVRNEGTEQAPNYVRRVMQEIVYNASLMVNGVAVATDKREFRWEKKRPNGSWTPIGTEYNGIPDLGWTITNNGATFTQKTMAIGEKTEMRVRVRYGDLETATFNDASPTEYFTMVRRLPDYDYDYIGVPDNLEAGIENVYPEAYVEDRYGRVENFEEELMPRWYTGAGSTTGHTTLELIDTVKNPKIPTSKINTHGMILALDLDAKTADRGNYKVVTDNGAVVVEVIDGVEYIVISK